MGLVPKRLRCCALTAVLFVVGSPLFADPPVDPTPDTGNFIDRTHDVISNIFYWPIAVVDNWFWSENEEFETNQSFFRVINNLTWVDRDGFEFDPKIRVKVRLKALQRKLSLIAFGEKENEASPDITANRQSEATQLTRDNTQIGRDNTRTRVGLRFNFFDWIDSRFDADVVVSKDLFPEPSLRGRQNLFKTKNTLSRFTVTGFYKEDLKFGQTTRLDLTQTLSKRWNYETVVTGRNSERFPDLEWDSLLGINYLLSSREALALRLQAIGPTHPHFIVTNYRTSTVYRRNFYRSWMFYELEPGVDWPYVNYHRRPVWSMAFRLELLFKSR